ncbi:TOPRS ligase, partial [Glareola pratincola]|nr:TOPRS ligase [Glareola pratincola]
MATESEWSCPICYDAKDGLAYVLPCRHQFCVGCVLRWAKRSVNCPLCRGRMAEVRFSVRGDNDYVQFLIMSSKESPQDSSQAGRAPTHLDSAASPAPSSQGTPLRAEQGAARTEARATVGGLLPEVWALLYRQNYRLLDPVLPWLRWRLEAVFGEQWWLARGAESQILQALCLCGLNEEALVQRMQPVFQEHTALLVQGLINAIVHRCREEAQRLLRTLAARAEEDDDRVASSSPTRSSPTSSSPTRPTSSRPSRSSPNSSSSTSSSSSQERTPALQQDSSSSPADSDVEERPTTTSQAALRRAPSCPPSTPIPGEQEQGQEVPEEAAVAGPSAQDSSRSPSAPDQGRNHLPGRPRRPPKRRAPSPQDSPQPRKRPPRRRR